MEEAWDETRAAAEHWAAAVEGWTTRRREVDDYDATTSAVAWLDEALPLRRPLLPPPPVPALSPPPLATSGDDGGESGELAVQRAPVLDDGDSLLDHPDLVWAEDAWDESREKEAREAIARQGATLPAHRVQWYDRTAGKQWDLFYKRNKDRFFKDRHYLLRDFPDLASPPPLPPPAPSSLTTGEYSCGGGGGNMAAGTSDTARPEPHHTVLVEAGCGVGNAVFPLLESHPDMFVYALDFSPRAIQLVKRHPLYQATKRCRAFVCDLVADSVPLQVREEGGGADLVLLMYSLSAVAPEAMPDVARKLHGVLKPGGRVLLRDYGRWDEAQLRFKRGHKLADNFYLRSDGTRAFYFSLDDVRRIFVEEAGFVEIEAGYIRRQYANRGQGATRRRTWIHARFEKPTQASQA